MTRPARGLAAAIALLLLVGLGTLVAHPLRGMRNDIHAQRGLLAAQLATTRTQLDVARLQLRAAEQSREAADQTLLLVRELALVSRRIAADVHRATGAGMHAEDLAVQLLAITRDIEALARSTERHAASLDHKTGPTTP